MRALRRWIVVVMVILQSVLGALPVLAQGNSRAVYASHDPRNRMLLTLTGEVTALNTVQLSWSATPLQDAPAIEVKWDVDGAQLLNGPAEEILGAVAAQSNVQQARTVILPGQGVYKLYVLVRYRPYPSAQVGASALLFALVDAGGVVTLSARDPNVVDPMHSIMPTTVTVLDAEAESSSTDATHDDPCFTITGTVSREG
jgi:hypothetical protein